MNNYIGDLYVFKDDGLIPNSKLPVVVYKHVTDSANKSDWFEQRFQQNGWTNNWRDIVLSYDHFHSNTHEALAVGKGKVTLKIGGRDGLELRAEEGDVIILPSGVGHYAISTDADYEIVGGYPYGATWDMCTGTEADRSAILKRIKDTPLPLGDPIYGIGGELLKHWSQV